MSSAEDFVLRLQDLVVGPRGETIEQPNGTWWTRNDRGLARTAGSVWILARTDPGRT